MNKYQINYRDDERDDWKSDTMGEEIPSTPEGAADLLRYLRTEMGPGYSFQVLYLCDDTGRWTDLTSSIEIIIEEQDAAADNSAELDAQHERQERHSWSEVG